MRKHWAVLAFILAPLFLFSCNSSEKEIEESPFNVEQESEAALRVGFSQVENENPWRIAQTISITEEAAKRGIELIYADAGGSTEKQIDDVRYLIEQNIDYLIFDPREYEESAPALDIAREAGVPVIVIDRSVKGEPGVDYLVEIVADFHREGERAGLWLKDALDGTGNVVELLGTPGSSAAIGRHEGFRDAISDAPGIRVIDAKSADFLRAEAQRVMESIIQSKGNRITAVFAHNDEMAIGAIQALKNAGLAPGEDAVVVGIDGAKDAVKAIIAGEMGATVVNNPFYGPTTFDVIERIERGEDVSERIVRKETVIQQSNAAEEIDNAF